MTQTKIRRRAAVRHIDGAGHSKTARNVRKPSLTESFVQRVSATPGGCWEWTGRLTADNYPLFYVDQQRPNARAHRWLWERLVGPIPAGFEVDHCCQNTKCVRPGHCQILTAVQHRQVTAGRKALRKILGTMPSVQLDHSHTSQERLFGYSHGLPVAADVCPMRFNLMA